jgi:hypothetical protein
VAEREPGALKATRAAQIQAESGRSKRESPPNGRSFGALPGRPWHGSRPTPMQFEEGKQKLREDHGDVWLNR